MPRGSFNKRSDEATTAVVPSGPASGDLAGNYPNPTVDGLQGKPLDATVAAPIAGDMLIYDGAKWILILATSADTASTVVERSAAKEINASVFQSAGNASFFSGGLAYLKGVNTQIEATTGIIVLNAGAAQIVYVQQGGATKMQLVDAAGQMHVGGDADVANVNLRVNGLTTVGSTIGAGNALPALPEGYLEVNINGTVRKIPYYNV